ncbi:MAG: hypothetical protein ABIG98_04990 [Chloroflexota bacterium]
MKPRALVVEASPARRRLLEAVLSVEGFDVQVQAEAGEQGHPPDLVVLGSCLSGTDPFSLCSGIKERDGLVPVLMVAEGEEGRLRGWEVGADEVLLRPLRRRELASRARALVRLRRLYEGLVEGEKVLLALAEAVEAQDPYARGHTRKAMAAALALGERSGLSAEDLRELRLGAILHDAGKVGLDRAILLKGGEPFPRGVAGGEGPPGAGMAHCPAPGEGGGGGGPLSPRALGRRGLPRRVEGRGDTPSCPDNGPGRCLFRPRLPPALPPRLHPGEGPPHYRPGIGKTV